MSYYNATVDTLFLATNETGTWETMQVADGPGVGKYNSLAVDQNETLYIAYYQETNKDLLLAKRTSGSWTFENVDSTGDVGQFASLFLNGDNNIHISYTLWDDGENHSSFKYATNHSGEWVSDVAAN